MRPEFLSPDRDLSISSREKCKSPSIVSRVLSSGKGDTGKPYNAMITLRCLGLPGTIYLSASFDIYLWCISLYQVIPLHTP